MRCKPGQLAANLEGKGKNKGLASIYLLHGEEPLQLIHEYQKLVKGGKLTSTTDLAKL